MSLLNKVRHAFKWSFYKTIFSQFLSPLLRIIAIPIIGTYDYGIFGIIYIYFGLLDALLGAGIRDFILSKSISKKSDLKMLNSIALIWSVFFLLISALLSFFLSNIYDLDEVSKYLFIMSFTFPFIGFGLVSEAITVRQLNFKKVFFIEMIPFFSTLFIVIPLAFKGYGLIGLVAGEMSTRILKSISYYYLNPVLFKWPSSNLYNKIIKFIKWILGERVLEYSSTTIDTFFISFLGPSIVGVYNLGKNIINIIFTITNAPLGNIWLSFFGRIKNSLENSTDIFMRFLFIIIVTNISIAFLGAISSFFFFQSFLSNWNMLNIVCVYLFISGFFRRTLWINRDFLKTINKLKVYPMSIIFSLIIYAAAYLLIKPSEISQFLSIKLIYDFSYFVIFIFMFKKVLRIKINRSIILNFFSKTLSIFFVNAFALSLSLFYLKTLSLIDMILFLIIIFGLNLLIVSNYLINNYTSISTYISKLKN
tara:strand:- start:17008 stop:18441 length:1434 start_codon:yes stop_codon:yes gene_type:complete